MPKLDTTPTPPIAEKKPNKITQLGISRSDDYGWMKDENWQAMMADTSKLDPKIRKHLEAENAYTQAVTQNLSCLLYTSPSPRD